MSSTPSWWRQRFAKKLRFSLATQRTWNVSSRLPDAQSLSWSSDDCPNLGCSWLARSATLWWCAILRLFFLPAAFAQTLPHELSAGFRYEVKVAQSYTLENAPGYTLKYAYRPLRWLAFEAGLEQIPRPVGASVCCRFESNANDELFLVPFGARYVWEGGRVRLSAGVGGAWLDHTFPSHIEEGFADTSAWGGQFVASGDFALTRSGRFRAGLTARYYYIPLPGRAARLLTTGPDFTFSFGRPRF